MKIAIVNQELIAIEAIGQVLKTVPEYQIAWVARNGAQAIAKCAQDIPDLILMDLLLSEIDGIEATKQIMKNSPCAIILVTANVNQNSGKVFEAMGYGALDVVSTPILETNNILQGSEALLGKIATIKKLIGKPSSNSHSTTQNKTFRSHLPPLIAIGSSTGGPKALASILTKLPANFGAAIAIVQHLDAQFAAGLVEWLNEQTPLSVMLASEGSYLEAGKVLIAGTNDHLFLQPNLTLSYTKEPSDYPYRPSVDVFFQSLAQNWSRKGTAVLLTGMGKDGAQGLSALRSKGWHTIAQNQASCVVYGMPKAAVELGAAQQILPLEAIASTLINSLVTIH
jgi:two-component system response regulator WspF